MEDGGDEYRPTPRYCLITCTPDSAKSVHHCFIDALPIPWAQEQTFGLQIGSEVLEVQLLPPVSWRSGTPLPSGAVQPAGCYPNESISSARFKIIPLLTNGERS